MIKTITVGVPAYNSGAHIFALLTNISKQKGKSFLLKKIVVYCDACTDNTVAEVQRVRDQRIEIINDRKRGGMARGLIKMLQANTSDLFVLFNDDIEINDSSILEKVVQRFSQNKNVGLVSGNPQPLQPINFIESAGISTFRVYQKMRYQLNDGDNKFTCDGKFLAMSSAYLKKLKFPKNPKDMANVDAYLYLSCLENNFLYRHVRDAKVYFNFPRSVQDYIKWNSRNNADPYILKKRFGDLLIKKVYQKPQPAYRNALVQELLTHPVSCGVMFLLGRYCQYKAQQSEKWLKPTWDVVASTKRVDV
jgi:GT2 family glycosyltransferase